jgi:hypothetical protein
MPVSSLTVVLSSTLTRTFAAPARLRQPLVGAREG